MTSGYYSPGIAEDVIKPNGSPYIQTNFLAEDLSPFVLLLFGCMCNVWKSGTPRTCRSRFCHMFYLKMVSLTRTCVCACSQWKTDMSYLKCVYTNTQTTFTNTNYFNNPLMQTDIPRTPLCRHIATKMQLIRAYTSKNTYIYTLLTGSCVQPLVPASLLLCNLRNCAMISSRRLGAGRKTRAGVQNMLCNRRRPW